MTKALAGFICLALCVAACASVVAQQLPVGAKITVTQKALNYVTQTSIPILEKAATTASIPDVHGSTEALDMTIDYDITSIQVVQFDIGSFSIASGSAAAGPGTISVVLSNVDLHVTMNWHYEHDGFPYVSDSGSGDATSSGTSVALVLGIYAGASGKPGLSVKSCAVNFGDFNIDLHGGASWLYNLIVDLFKGSILSDAQSALQQAVTQAIDQQVDQELAQLNMVIAIDNVAEVNFQLSTDPETADQYVMLPSLAEVFPLSGQSPFPFQPVSLPDTLGTDAMIHIILSDAAANSAGYVYAQAGVLSYTLTQADIPPSVPLQLNTTFFRFFIPQLYKMFPNDALEIRIQGAAPTLVTSNGQINVSIPLTMSLLVLAPNGSLPDAFDLGVLIDAEASVSVCSSSSSSIAICGQLSVLDMHFKLLHSMVGPFDPSPLETIVNALAQSVVIPMINQRLQQGFPIPALPSVTLQNPEIVLGEGYFGVSSDMIYSPSA